MRNGITARAAGVINHGASAWGAALCLLLSSVAGCGGNSGPEQVPVSGTVTFEGQPVPEGNIIFHGADETIAPDASKIRDGKFEFLAKPGKKRIQINATRDVPGKTRMGADDNPVPVREQYIPERYNTPESELTAEVEKGSGNTFAFEL